MARYVELDRMVDEAEGSGIMARLEFGLEVLAERGDRKQLPAGRLDEIAAAPSARADRRLGYELPSPTSAPDRGASFTCREKLRLSPWHEIVAEGLTVTPRLTPGITPAIVPAGVFNVIQARPRRGSTTLRKRTTGRSRTSSPNNGRCRDRRLPGQRGKVHPVGDSLTTQSYSSRDRAPSFLQAPIRSGRMGLRLRGPGGLGQGQDRQWAYWFRQQHETLLVGRRGNRLSHPTGNPSVQRDRRSKGSA